MRLPTTPQTLAPFSLASFLAFQEKPEAFEVVYTDERGKEHALRFLGDAGTFDKDSRFYVAGFEFGPSYLIHVSPYRGDGFGDAWDAFIEALPTIPDDELPEAYQDADGESFYDLAGTKLTAETPCPNYWEREAWEAWYERKRALAVELLKSYGEDDEGVYPDLVEGYEMDDSGNVKSVGHYAWMNEVSPECVTFRPKAKEDSAE